jgi:zinc protease
MKKTPILTLIVVLMAVALCAGPPTVPKIPPLKFTDTRLDNGLRVIVMEDHFAPVYSIAVAYNVGSRNERQGRTGFAHLFEHMMFKGSEKVGPGEHFFLIFSNGGNMNGTTNQERTNYYETLPKNQLDLGLFLESDRMRSLAITKENLDNQRNAVQEERRLGLDNQPYGRTFEKVQELTYENFAYKHTTIGSMEDLNAASVDDVKDFFRTYYAPNNAVLVLVGDLDTRDTLVRVKKFFGGIPRQEAPPPVDVTEPAQSAERRAKLDDKLARLARVDISYKITPADTPDAYAAQVLATVLCGGDSSRLYQRLVKEKEVASGVGGSVGRSRGPSAFHISATARPGKGTEEIESLIYEEIAKLQSEPVKETELQRARAFARRAAVQQRESSLARCTRMADDVVMFNDPNLINTAHEKVEAVTAVDVQRVAREYLMATGRTVVVTVPAGGAR